MTERVWPLLKMVFDLSRLHIIHKGNMTEVFFSNCYFPLRGSLGGCWSLSHLHTGKRRALGGWLPWQCSKVVLAPPPASSTPFTFCPLPGLEARTPRFSALSPKGCETTSTKAEVCCRKTHATTVKGCSGHREGLINYEGGTG